MTLESLGSYGLIVKVVVPTTEPVATLDVAWIVVDVAVVVAAIFASPGVALLNVTADVVELHVTELVRFCVVVPSEKVPIAVNCCVGVAVWLTVLSAGVIAMLDSVRPTTTVAEAGVTPPALA
jgi:hypothetical protein